MGFVQYANPNYASDDTVKSSNDRYIEEFNFKQIDSDTDEPKYEMVSAGFFKPIKASKKEQKRLMLKVRIFIQVKTIFLYRSFYFS